jgi:hypothetical protein
MPKVRRLGVFSLAKFQAVLVAPVGLLVGFLYSFGGLIIDAMVSAGWITSSETPGLSYGTILAFGALIGMPLIFTAFAFAAGLIEALIYNILAKRFGGVSIDIQ